MAKKNNEWVCGYACAISALLEMDGASTYVKEAFHAQFSSVEDAKKQGVDEYDLDVFRKHKEQLEYRYRHQ